MQHPTEEEIKAWERRVRIRKTILVVMLLTPVAVVILMVISSASRRGDYPTSEAIRAPEARRGKPPRFD
jgi:hypothetical protein